MVMHEISFLYVRMIRGARSIGVISSGSPLLPFTGSSVFLSLTDRAQTVQFQFVILHEEFVLPCHILLKFFDPGVFKLDDRAALGADQVVVMTVGSPVLVA